MTVRQSTRLIITAAVPTVAYVRQTTAAASADVHSDGAPGHAGGGGDGKVLLIQKLLDPNLDPMEELRQRKAQTSLVQVEGGDVYGRNGYDDGCDEEVRGFPVPVQGLGFSRHCDGYQWLSASTPFLFNTNRDCT